MVGAGPAGATLGYYLGKLGRKVLLLEKKTFPRDKYCGDAVCKTAIEILHEMGIYEQLLREDKAHVVTQFINIGFVWFLNFQALLVAITNISCAIRIHGRVEHMMMSFSVLWMGGVLLHTAVHLCTFMRTPIAVITLSCIIGRVKILSNIQASVLLSIRLILVVCAVLGVSALLVGAKRS